MEGWMIGYACVMMYALTNTSDVSTTASCLEGGFDLQRYHLLQPSKLERKLLGEDIIDRRVKLIRKARLVAVAKINGDRTFASDATHECRAKDGSIGT